MHIFKRIICQIRYLFQLLKHFKRLIFVELFLSGILKGNIVNRILAKTENKFTIHLKTLENILKQNVST